MRIETYKASSRGHADYGWLKTWYSFSFAGYYDPARVHFGALRVLNDDTIAGGGGFDLHPHDNMEIVTIVLEGELEHKDSMGNTGVIRQDEVQVMTAGTGIYHSEYNRSGEQTLRLLQIWVFPDRKGHTPRYDQKRFDPAARLNAWQTLVSPVAGDSLFIHQETWFSRITLAPDKEATYSLNGSQHGLFLFVIEGAIETGDLSLGERDAAGMTGISMVTVKALRKTELLVIEVPVTA
jgi:redox-sensitive bicupin YhaK (pirin superfamily)